MAYKLKKFLKTGRARLFVVEKVEGESEDFESLTAKKERVRGFKGIQSTRHRRRASRAALDKIQGAV